MINLNLEEANTNATKFIVTAPLASQCARVVVADDDRQLVKPLSESLVLAINCRTERGNRTTVLRSDSGRSHQRTGMAGLGRLEPFAMVWFRPKAAVPWSHSQGPLSDQKAAVRTTKTQCGPAHPRCGPRIRPPLISHAPLSHRVRNRKRSNRPAGKYKPGVPVCRSAADYCDFVATVSRADRPLVGCHHCAAGR